MNYLKDKEIFKRISFTFMMCLLFYVIGRIPLPLASTHKGNIIVENMLQLTAGTSQLSLFMLGVGPYITVSIIVQLLSVFESLPFYKWKESGPAGQEKIKKFTYILTFITALLQASVITVTLPSLEAMGILKSSGWFVTSLLLIILAGGSLFVAFLAERINEKGIGSGVTMFIVTGIAVRLPESIILKTRDLINHFSTGFMWKYIAVMVGMLALIAILIVALYMERRVYVYPSAYSIDDKLHYIPIKILASSILPVIIVGSVFGLINQLETYGGFNFSGTFDLTRYRGIILYGLATWLFTYWYNYVQLNPSDIEKQLKHSNFYMKDVAPNDMAKVINNNIIKASHLGAPFLAFIVVLPLVLTKLFNIGEISYFMSTSLILLISGSIEFFKQVHGLYVSRTYNELLGGKE